MISADILILGCGWAGVSAAYHLLSRGMRDVMCIDSDDAPGGLMKTIELNGFIFDIGGSHIIFSSNELILKELIAFLDGNAIKHHRKAFVLLQHVSVPYPFENGLYVLPPSMRAEIMVSFIESLLELAKNPLQKPKNLEEYFRLYFGKELTELYLKPYNEKVWKRSLNEIDIDWLTIPGRLPVSNWRDIVKSAVGIPTVGYKEQAIFYYPLRGGIQALYNSILNKALDLGLKLITGTKVRSIKRGAHGKWIVNNEIEAKKNVSTIPLKELANIIDIPDISHELTRYSKLLDFNSLIVIGIALRKKAPDMHWVYVPDKNIIFHRYAWISNYSPYNTPNQDEFSSLIVEITLRPQELESIRIEGIIDKVIQGLKNLNLISESEREILFTKAWIHVYGYPIHTHQSNNARIRILNSLSNIGIEFLGRWSTWRYLNMDKIFEESKHLTKNLLT
jgi:protoporphyrinogen oxidase